MKVVLAGAVLFLIKLVAITVAVVSVLFLAVNFVIGYAAGRGTAGRSDGHQED